MFTTEDGAAVYPDTMTALMRKLIGDHNEPAIPGRGRGPPAQAAARPGLAAAARPAP